MSAVSRLTDLWVGICCCHSDPTCIDVTGIIITGSPNAVSASLANSRFTDMTIATCDGNHTGTIVTGSGRNFTNNLGKAFIGSMVTGCNIGIVVTGSPRHTSS